MMMDVHAVFDAAPGDPAAVGTAFARSYLLNGHPAGRFGEVLATAEANSLRAAAERGGSWPAEVERYWLRFEHAALAEFLRIGAMPEGGAA